MVPSQLQTSSLRPPISIRLPLPSVALSVWLV
jgi:hypothetical protein